MKATGIVRRIDSRVIMRQGRKKPGNAGVLPILSKVSKPKSEEKTASRTGIELGSLERGTLSRYPNKALGRLLCAYKRPI